MSLRILVAEDDPAQRAAMGRLLARAWPSAEVTLCRDGEEALAAIDEQAPTVAFLDVRMPGASGLEVARALVGVSHVVFVTAYEEHAIAAFDRGALDYLLKPIDAARFEETVRRIDARLAQAARPSAELTRELLGWMRAQRGEDAPALKWITASAGSTVRLFPIEEVLAFHARDKYTRVLTARDEGIIRTSLRELLGQLDPETFWQVHRSVAVRVERIDRLEREDGRHWLWLRGVDERFPVSAAFRARFRGM